MKCEKEIRERLEELEDIEARGNISIGVVTISEMTTLRWVLSDSDD